MLCLDLGLNCVIDVGANTGQFARSLRRHGYRGRIVSFEPVPSAYAVLARQAARDSAWLVQPFALGASAEKRVMQASEKGDTTSSLRSASQFGQEQLPSLRDTHSLTVVVERLDAVFAECVKGLSNPRVYLKLDTQGWDLEVLKGTTECLNHVVALQSEMAVHPLYDGSPVEPLILWTLG